MEEVIGIAIAAVLVAVLAYLVLRKPRDRKKAGLKAANRVVADSRGPAALDDELKRYRRERVDPG